MWGALRCERRVTDTRVAGNRARAGHPRCSDDQMQNGMDLQCGRLDRSHPADHNGRIRRSPVTRQVPAPAGPLSVHQRLANDPPSAANDVQATRGFLRTVKTWGGAAGERLAPATVLPASARATLRARLRNLPVDQTKLQFPHTLLSRRRLLYSGPVGFACSRCFAARESGVPARLFENAHAGAPMIGLACARKHLFCFAHVAFATVVRASCQPRCISAANCSGS
jgi:hypothetical protein